MIKFNVGCGKRNFGHDWIHVDGGDFDHLDSHDIFLKDCYGGSTDLIYTSHLIAYLDRIDVIELLECWKHVLRPGGKLEIATPDFNILYKLYHTGQPLEKILGPLFGRMEMNREFIYHKTTWDFKDLVIALDEAGFDDIKLYDHTKTCHPNTGNFSDDFDDHSCAYINGTLISLNIECTKPV